MATGYDAVVVGAGPSGVLVYERLAAQSARVLLLDAGPKLPVGSQAPRSDEALWRYCTVGANSEWWRVHAVGGRTLFWGGFSFRFPQVVFSDGGWPYCARTLAPYYAEAERWLGVVSGALTPRQRQAARALGIPFLPLRAARIGQQHWTALHTWGACHARPNQVATMLKHAAGRAISLQLKRPDGTPEEVQARAFVLAASPLETTRILLASGLKKSIPALGCRLVDHPPVNYFLVEERPADPTPNRRRFLEGALIPRFGNLDPSEQRPYRGGFSIEIIGPQPPANFSPEIARGLGIAPQDSGRYRLTSIGGLGETRLHKQRFVALKSSEQDSLGRPLLEIHLAWSAEEKRLIDEMKTACIQVADALATPGAELVLWRDPLQAPVLFHEAGTCTMGRDEVAPCDPWGRLRVLPNVWLADASVFPSAGDRHPTLTVLAHALRVTQSVSRYLAS